MSREDYLNGKDAFDSTDTRPNTMDDREFQTELQEVPVQTLANPNGGGVMAEVHMNNMIADAAENDEPAVAEFLAGKKAQVAHTEVTPSEVDALGRRPGEDRERWEARTRNVQSTVGEIHEAPEERERARREVQRHERAQVTDGDMDIIEREEMSRAAAGAWADEIQRDFEARAAAAGEFYDGLHERAGADAHGDPRKDLSQDELAKVNRGIPEVLDRVGMAADKQTVARTLARLVGRGCDIASAVGIVETRYEEGDYGTRPITGIEQWMSRYDSMTVTIVGEVTDAYEPYQDNQFQVLTVDDGSGQTIKVTVWRQAVTRRNHRNGDPEYTGVRVGDVVRFEDCRVDAYDGQVALRFIKNQDIGVESRVHVRERGDGRLIINGADINEPASPEGSVTREDALKAQVEKRKRGYHNPPQSFIGVEADPDEIGDYEGGEWCLPITWVFAGSIKPDRQQGEAGEDETRLADGACPADGCDFEGDTFEELRGHIGGKVNAEGEDGAHAAVQARLDKMDELPDA